MALLFCCFYVGLRLFAFNSIMTVHAPSLFPTRAGAGDDVVGVCAADRLGDSADAFVLGYIRHSRHAGGSEGPCTVCLLIRDSGYSCILLLTPFLF